MVKSKRLKGGFFFKRFPRIPLAPRLEDESNTLECRECTVGIKGNSGELSF